MITRRDFVLATAAGTVAPWRIAPFARGAAQRPWIPTDGFLAGLPRLLELASVPGVAVAVLEGGEIVWRRAFGLANAETKAPVEADSVFPAASLGKPVFGYVVLKLVEDGLLDLDRPLVEYTRPDDLADDPRLERIAARHVLSHTTGLPNWRSRAAGTKLAPSLEPGERFQYSGEGFFWLQRAVEAITGQGVDRVMRDRLFAPAGMPRATYAWTEDHQRWTVFGHGNRGDLAEQFNRRLADPLLERARQLGKPLSEWTVADTYAAMEHAAPTLPRLPNFAVPNVAGSLICTVGEYARFVALMMAGRRRASFELGETGRRAMLTPRVELNRVLSWGLGWGLEAGEGARYCWHWGDNGIFRAFVVADPEAGRAIVVFTNGSSGPKVYQRIVADATGLDLAAFLWV